MQAAYSGDTLLSVCAVIANKLQCRKMWFCFPPVLGERKGCSPQHQHQQEMNCRTDPTLLWGPQVSVGAAVLHALESTLLPWPRLSPRWALAAGLTQPAAHLTAHICSGSACGLLLAASQKEAWREGEGAEPERPASPSTSLVVTLPFNPKSSLPLFDFHYIKSIPHKFLCVLHTHHLLSSLADS